MSESGSRSEVEETLRHDAPRTDAASTEIEASAWIRDGIVSGLLGAALVAVFFLIVDLVQGRPLWTPHALGTAVLFGDSVPTDASPSAVAVLGYTVLHGAAFLVAGLAASFAVLGRREQLGVPAGLLVAGALFVALEVFFFVFFTTFVDSVAGELFSDLGTGRIAMANVLAALLMAWTSLRPPLR